MYNIAVIGSGVIGLPTALAVQEKLKSKVKVTIFSDRVSPHTTGDVAAGLWTPYLLQDTPLEDIIKWSKVTQDYILHLWRNGEAEVAGISLQLVIIITTDPEFRLPLWLEITIGHSILTPKHMEYYNNKYKKQFTGGYSYMAFTWEASRFLPYFEQKFLQNGGEIRIEYIKNFEQLANYDVVVNCTGLESRKLVPDSNVEPIRGQIVRVEAPWQLYTFFVNAGDGGNYIIPNIDSVILGGTFQVGDSRITVNQTDSKFVSQGNFRFVPGLKTAKVIKEQAGLRPGRNKVRVELEIRNIGNKEMKIVHNYGHGGSGITLSIGCARDAAVFVENCLSTVKNKL